MGTEIFETVLIFTEKSLEDFNSSFDENMSIVKCADLVFYKMPNSIHLIKNKGTLVEACDYLWNVLHLHEDVIYGNKVVEYKG